MSDPIPAELPPAEPPSNAEAANRIVVKAFDVASAFQLREAERAWKQSAAKLIEDVPLVLQFDERRWLAMFEYGSVVFFNFGDDEIRTMLARLRPFEHRPNRVICKDDFSLYVGPQHRRPDGTEELFVKEFNRDIVFVTSIVLSRSVSLEYYEQRVDGAVVELERVVDSLERHGRITHRERDMRRMIGRTLAVEHELAYSLAVFDEPDVLWEGGAHAQKLYKALKDEFDLDDRIRILQHKLSIISKTTSFIISRQEARRDRLLEWIIIILIVAEIVLVLMGKM